MKNRIFGLLLVLAMILMSVASTPVQARSLNLFHLTSFLPNAQTPAIGQVYLPQVMRDRQTPAIVSAEVFGAQDQEKIMSKVKGANLHWARTYGLDWSAIEPVRTNPPTYNWDPEEDKNLAALSANEIVAVPMVRWVPSWAQMFPGSRCGPIAAGALDAFAQFMSAAVARYSAPPFNVHYWEIFNEPDVDHTYLPPDAFYGCWGNESDSYYGGGYYATMLERVYPAMKAVDPSAQVVLGGLLLDCDPTHPPTGKTCNSSNFLEGVLRNNGKMNGGNFFDILAFHGFPPYNGSLQLDPHYPSWEARGGVVLGKINFVREVMAKYGVNKPLFHTEASLICPEYDGRCTPPVPDFYEKQADYVVWLFVRNWAAGVQMTNWFEFVDNWRADGILYRGTYEPKPDYYSLKFMTEELGQGSFVQEVTAYAPLKQYIFNTSTKIIYVMWAEDEQPHPFNLVPGEMTAYDKYGNLITPPADNVIMINSPVYIEIITR